MRSLLFCDGANGATEVTGRRTLKAVATNAESEAVRENIFILAQCTRPVAAI